MSSLVKLAEDILSAAKALEAHFQSNGLPDPTFDNDFVVTIPPSLREQRKTLIDSTDRLKRLSLGVEAHADMIYCSWADHLTLRAIYKYKIASFVPHEESCSYASLATATGLTEQLLQRFLRHCMGNHIFAQTPDGQVRHTAFSRRLVTDSEFADGIGLQLDEVGPASTFTLDALRRFGESGEHRDAGFALLNQARNQEAGIIKPLQPIFDILAQNPERAHRFGVAMRYFTKGSSQDLRHLLAGFDWTSVDKPDSVLVDVGGGHGTVSQYLAQHTEKLRFVVQDSAETVRTAKKLLPVEFQGRIQFEAHDFFEPQEQRADVFFMRWVLHNWSDKYAVSILKSLVPAMKEGSRVILFEYLLDSEPETAVTEKHGRWVVKRLNDNVS